MWMHTLAVVESTLEILNKFGTTELTLFKKLKRDDDRDH